MSLVHSLSGFNDRNQKYSFKLFMSQTKLHKHKTKKLLILNEVISTHWSDERTNLCVLHCECEAGKVYHMYSHVLYLSFSVHIHTNTMGMYFILFWNVMIQLLRPPAAESPLRCLEKVADHRPSIVVVRRYNNLLLHVIAPSLPETVTV